MSNPPCLHCAIHKLIAEHFGEHGELDAASGNRVVDIHEVLTTLGQVTGETIEQIPARQSRRAATKLAHDCVDAGRVWARTGEPQAVMSGNGAVH